jgi:hypothetical protein
MNVEPMSETAIEFIVQAHTQTASIVDFERSTEQHIRFDQEHEAIRRQLHAMHQTEGRRRTYVSCAFAQLH